MSPFSLALFDMDDVLCHYDRSIRVRSLATLSGRTDQEVADAIWKSGLEAKADAGEVSDKEYLLETGRLIGHPVKEEDWLKSRRDAMSPNREVLELARAVSQHCRIAVLTNNPKIVSSNIGYLCPEVAGVFGNHVYASAMFSAAKPGVEVFHRCLNTVGVAPHAAFFVDDLLVNVTGARAAGLDAHQFTDPQSLADVLMSRGLLV